MAKSDFLNDAARCGAIVGLLLVLSSTFELKLVLGFSNGGEPSPSILLARALLILLEYFVAAALHFYLLYAAARRLSLRSTAAEGFSFGRGYGFALTASAFAGVILGAGNYVYIHLLLGYGEYIDRLSDTVVRLIGVSGTPLAETMLEVVDRIRETPAPSIFSTVLGGVWSSVLFGLIFGLIIAGVLARAPQPFDSQSND